MNSNYEIYYNAWTTQKFIVVRVDIDQKINAIGFSSMEVARFDSFEEALWHVQSVSRSQMSPRGVKIYG